METPVKIPLVDLVSQYKLLKSEVDVSIAKTIESSAFIGGRPLRDFESGFADLCSVKHAIGVGNGTDALELIFEAYCISAGDEIIVPSMTFAATAEAVIRVGAKPVFVDSDADTLNMDVAAVRAAVTARTRAIVAVHLYGQPADLDALGEIASEAGLVLVEDAAQAHGARWHGRRIGSIGNAAAFSFYPGKNLGAYGDGGAVTTNDDEIAARVRLLANHGRTEKYTHEISGRNSRLDALQAAVLGVKLTHVDEWNERRRQIAALYTQLLAGKVNIVSQDPRAESVFHLYVIQVAGRDRIRDALSRRGIATGIHYPIPLHRQPAFAQFADTVNPDDWVASRASSRVLSLPIFPELSDDDVHRIANALTDVLDAH